MTQNKNVFHIPNIPDGSKCILYLEHNMLLRSYSTHRTILNLSAELFRVLLKLSRKRVLCED